MARSERRTSVSAGVSAGVSAIVLAAGTDRGIVGSSVERPTPLQDICGQPMVLSAVHALVGAGIDNLVVVVHRGAEHIAKALQGSVGDTAIAFVEQQVQRGTGDAALAGLAALDDPTYLLGARTGLQQARSFLDDGEGEVMVVHGDLPLLTADLVRDFLDAHLGSDVAATALTSFATGPAARRSRVVHSADGRVVSIEADGEGEEAAAGLYLFRRSLLAAAIRRTTPQNDRGVFDLNDTFGVLTRAGHSADTHLVADVDSVRSVSSENDVAEAAAILRQRITRHWMAQGVSMVDPSRTYIDLDVVLSAGVTLHPGTILRGETVVGEGAELGPDTHLTDCAVGAGARVIRSTGCDAEIGPGAVVGPFVSLEPGAQIAPNVTTGSFITAKSTG